MTIQKFNIKQIIEESEKSSTTNKSGVDKSVLGDSIKIAMGIITKIPLKVWAGIVGFLLLYGLGSLIVDIICLF